MNKNYLVVILYCFFSMSSSAHAKVYLSLEEAVLKYYPNCKTQDESFFLTSEQVKKAESISGLTFDSKLLNRKILQCSSGIKTLYLDVHVVRTQKEVLLVVLSGDVLERVEILSFYEPTEYIPGKKWYELFKGVRSGSPIKLGENIPYISGASLTSRATVNAVKKIMSLHEVVNNVKK